MKSENEREKTVLITIIAVLYRIYENGDYGVVNAKGYKSVYNLDIIKMEDKFIIENQVKNSISNKYIVLLTLRKY